MKTCCIVEEWQYNTVTISAPPHTSIGPDLFMIQVSLLIKWK